MTEDHGEKQNLQPQNCGKAIASMVCSIAGLFFCFFVGQIIGIILGYNAKKEIRESKGKLTGEEFATAGIVVGWIGLVVDTLIVGFFLALFSGFTWLSFLAPFLAR